nr:hypothetical protein [Paucibacter sp. M5-1]MCZ7879789.1 hypothetical protein [Paucibacter sp. M5-1]
MTSINKRRLLIGAAGLGAAALGVGYGLRGHRPEPLSAAANTFWSSSFERPEGVCCRPAACGASRCC